MSRSSVSLTVPTMATPAERLPDETLLAGLGAGDAELSVAFVRRFQGLVFGVALTVLRDRNVAEDVAQQAFERAWSTPQMFDGAAGDGPRLADQDHPQPGDRRAPRALVGADGSGRPGAAAHLDRRLAGADRGRQRQRRRAPPRARRLPAEQARAVAMAGIYGMTARQVAECGGDPVGTAKTRIRYGLQKLRAALLPEDADDE